MRQKKYDRKQRFFAGAFLIVAFLFFHGLIGANYRHDDGSVMAMELLIMAGLLVLAFVVGKNPN